MGEIIDLDFYRKFRIVLPVRLDSLQPHPLPYEKTGQHTKRFRRRRKLDVVSKTTKKKES